MSNAVFLILLLLCIREAGISFDMDLIHRKIYFEY